MQIQEPVAFGQWARNSLLLFCEM